MRRDRSWRGALGRLLLLVGAAGTGPAGPIARAQEASPAAGRDRGAERLDFANRLLRDRRYDLAAEEYEAALRALPPGPPAAAARYGLANARLFLGQYKEARRVFEAFLENAPDDPNAATAWFRVGETAYMLGDLPAARTALETYTATFPKHRHIETAWPYLGDVCFRLNDLAAARRAYEMSLAETPDGRLVDRARYGLARTRAAQGDPDAALPLLEAVAKSSSRDWAEKARYQVGLVQLAAGRYEPALKAFEALEQAAPNSPLLPEARLRRAEALTRLDRHDEAVVLLSPLLARDDAIAPQAAYALATAELRRGRPAEALAACDAALGRFPESALSPLLQYRSAEAAAAQDRPADARARFLEVAERFPKDDWADDALVQAAEQALEAGDAPGARALARSLAERFPGSPLRPGATLTDARAAMAAGAPADAVALLEGLLKDPAAVPAELAQGARLALGAAYRAAGQPEKAAETLKAMTAAPGAAPDAQYLVGAGHADAGRFAEAIPALEAYLAARPRGDVAPDAMALLAIAQGETGGADAARATLARLAAAFPDTPVLARARLRLGESALGARQYDAAAPLLRDAATAADPAVQARARVGLGWALLEAGHAAEAADAFRAAIDAKPAPALAADALLGCARALDESGKPAEALQAYELLLANHKDSAAAPAAALARARGLARAGRPADAAEAFAAYLRDYPNPPKDGEPTDGVLAERGWALLDADRRADAEIVFRRLLDEHPASPRTADARVALAESAQRAGKLDEAEAMLAPVVAPDAAFAPETVAAARLRLGLIRADRRDWAGTIKEMDALLALRPDGPLAVKARFWKAEAALQSGDAAAAEAAFAALIAPPTAEGAPAWLDTARLRHVESLVLLRRWAPALEAADALRRDRPDLPAKHELDYARGQALQGLARFDEARDAYQAVIDAGQEDDYAARAQLMKGETYFHQEKYNDALKEYLRVEYQYDAPTHQAAALLQAGKVAEELDRWTDAADFYEKTTKKYPAEPAAKEAAERLGPARQKAGTPAP
jgi:TolA-binding protein